MDEPKRNLDVEYARGQFAPRFILAGRSLVPMTFGHAMLLTAVESPLVPWVGGSAGEVHIAQFALICSRGWRRAAKVVNGPFAKWWLKVSQWMVMPGKTVQELIVAISYVRFHFADSLPVSVVDIGGGRKVEHSAAPVLASLASRFIFAGGSRDELMDSPLRMLRWEALVASERDGVIRISEQADDLIARAKEEVLANWKANRRGRTV